MNIVRDLQNAQNIMQAKSAGRGPFTSAMLKAFGKGRCQKCDAKIHRFSFRNALVVEPQQVKYICRGCRGLFIQNLGNGEDIDISEFTPYVAVSIFVNLRYDRHIFSNYDTIKLLREAPGLVFHDNLLETKQQHVSEVLNRSPNLAKCGECLWGKITDGVCGGCGTPAEFQWHTRISEREERAYID